MYAYHIDRTASNLFRPGDNLTISKLTTKFKATNIKLRDTYESKLSKHGQQYFSNSINPNRPWDYLYETIFEYERRINFPDRPSRYQSFFAIKNIDDIKYWQKSLNLIGEEHIWKVSYQDSNAFESDASWLKLSNHDQSVVRLSYNANQYWQGKNRPDFSSEPELLIKNTIKLVERIY